MLGVERLDGIMEMLKDGQAVSIHTLSKALYISESTLRRDLAALQKEGLIRRIRGGAILAANNRDVPRLIRENEAPDIKNIIGARAAELVHPGDVILLDPSTTCSYMVPYLPQHTDLLAITSGLKTALALSERHIRTMVTGRRGDGQFLLHGGQPHRAAAAQRGGGRHVFLLPGRHHERAHLRLLH